MPSFSALLSCALVLALVQPQQGPPKQPPPGQDRPEPIRPTPLPGAQKEIDRQKKLIVGMWRMVELRDNLLPPGNRKEFAHCLITPDFLSFELHIDWLGDEARIEHRVFESGIYFYDILESNKIEMRAVIGALADPGGMTRFRPAGYLRRYTIELEADRMVWTRSDGQATIFERTEGPSALKKRDIYGRVIPEKRTDEPATPTAPTTKKPRPKAPDEL
jgi:hypothetical protein